LFFGVAEMEALIAVGLAGNVVTFIQFAHELIREAKSIKATGSASSIPELRKWVAYLTEQSGDFQKRLKGANATVHQEDQVQKIQG
jgi:hypothetical protein